mgnify:CR=1 FL=1
MKKEFKSGYIAVVGETNAGKSTFINRFIGEELSIVTPKPQTTRKNVLGIYTDENMQAIFIDTPGLHKRKSSLSDVLNTEAIKNIKDADIVIHLVSLKEKNINQFNLRIIEELKKYNKKAILILNKEDLVNGEEIALKIKEYNKEYEYLAIIPVSLKTEKKSRINEIKDIIFKNLNEGPKYFPDDEYTDQDLRTMCAEIIRKKVLKFVREEIPHGIYVEIDEFKERKTTKKEDIIDIHASIYVSKENHKGIVIGKNGALLKQIGTTARLDIEKFLDEKVNLKLLVKVKRNWLEDPNVLKRFKS